MKLYFGHPVNTYSTEREYELEDLVKEYFPDSEIENPNQFKHSQGYKLFKGAFGDGMRYYEKLVLPKMDSGVFLPFDDGMFGAGVYREAKFLQDQGSTTYKILEDKMIVPLSPLEETFKLSVEETRRRVYNK